MITHRQEDFNPPPYPEIIYRMTGPQGSIYIFRTRYGGYRLRLAVDLDGHIMRFTKETDWSTTDLPATHAWTTLFDEALMELLL